MRHEIAIGMNQKGLLCDRKGRRAHVHPSRQEALLMRLSVDSLRRVVKRDLAIEFVPQQLTSFGGLELLRRYVQRLALAARLRRACASAGWGLQRREPWAADPRAPLRGGPTPGAPAVSRRRPARHAVLWLGAGADAPDREQLASALHPGASPPPGATQPRPGHRGHRSPEAAAAHH